MDVSLVTVDKTEYWFTKDVCSDEAAALKLLYEQPQVASKQSSPGLTPLVIALENKASDAVVRKLIDYYPRAAATTKSGSLPLHIAAALGASPAVVGELLRINPDAARVAETHGHEFLPVHLALRNVFVQDNVVGLIVDRYPFGEMTLPELVKCGEQTSFGKRRTRLPATEAALRLLDREPALAQQVRESDGATPLHMCFIYGAADELVLRLLAIFPEAARVPDKSGNRPINIAMQHARSAEVVRALLAA